MKLAYYAEAWLARSVMALLRALPPAAASNLGGTVARTIGPLLPPSRTAHANLRAAMPALSAADRKRVVRGVWENLGRTVAELPHLAALRRDTPRGPGFTVRNEHSIAGLAQPAGPIVFCSAHIGNWEFLPSAAASIGLPFAGVYRATANPLLNDLILSWRAQGAGSPLPMFDKGASGARGAMKHLAGGGRLALLVDQKMNDGIEARLFSMKAMTAGAAAAFALRYRCPIVCGHVAREGPARLCVILQAPLVLPDSGDKRRDILTLTQQINDVLESWIREKPESWLWLHRRWPADVVVVKQRKKGSRGAAR